jgi:RNA polymerase sigma-70 factor (ECF subfamily)
MKTEDASDVEAVLAGDLDRFERIIARWEKALVNLAWRFVQDEDLANEIAHDAFVLSFRRLKQWRAESSFGTWLYGIALNVCRSRLRSLRRSPPMTPLESVHPSVPPEDFERRRTREIVRREIDRLPIHYREAIILTCLEEQDVATAAAMLGIPAGTLKARLHRARRLLRVRLEGVLP